jgi:hypothetical protein
MSDFFENFFGYVIFVAFLIFGVVRASQKKKEKMLSKGATTQSRTQTTAHPFKTAIDSFLQQMQEQSAKSPFAIPQPSVKATTEPQKKTFEKQRQEHKTNFVSDYTGYRLLSALVASAFILFILWALTRLFMIGFS